MKTKIILFLFTGLFLYCGGESKNEVSAKKIRNYANELYNKGLYIQAVEESRRYIDKENMPDRIQANINYTIGNIYFDRLNDYQNALAYYLKIKHFYPESELINNTNQRIIACLERMDKSSEAEQVLKETTSIDKSQVPENKPGEVIAMIGDRKITLGDLEFEMNKYLEQTPAELRPEKVGKNEKLAFLRQYLTSDLLYNKAKKMGLDRDKEVIDGIFSAKKNLMAMKVIQDEFKNKIKIDKEDIELYYEKNKENFAEKDEDGKVKNQKSLEEAKEEVYNEVLLKKQQEVMDGLLMNLMQAQDVKIFEDKIK